MSATSCRVSDLPIETQIEIGKYLSTSRETVLKYINKKGIPTLKLGRWRRFKISEVDEWLRSGNVAEKEETDLTELNGGL